MKHLILSISLLFATLGMSAQKVNYEVRLATNPTDFKTYTTERIRQDFLIDTVFASDEINMVYSMYDRFIMGGAMPVAATLKLEAIDPLKAPNFLYRRELGIINVGGPGKVMVGKETYKLGFKDALYVGSGSDEVSFVSDDATNPAKFYFNSAAAHQSYPTKLIKLKDTKAIHAGSDEESNKRIIYKYIVNETVKTCQLQMGLTELAPGNVWNTMPCHSHLRRMEAYFYFNLPEKQAVAHFMGEASETRVVWVHNEQIVISPEWSIHSGSGTSSYMFIWGMAGENLDYTDMDKHLPVELK